MAVGLSLPGHLYAVNGVRLAAGHGGVKKNGSDDLLIIALDEGAAVAGVFTQNAYCAAPVTVSIEHLANASTRALLVNSGNANAGTGAAGYEDAKALCAACSEQLGVGPEQVLPFSTGVIGERLPVAAMQQRIVSLGESLASDAWLSAAHAIMTTDTLPKAVSRQLDIDGQTITITGISKGSGMIHPNMATLLSFVTTDAVVDSA
ncbi:MAG: bifunctional ornithine acetyltransferase/N-acetylglutamate synthase, partial [Pseudomonadota bacterium]